MSISVASLTGGGSQEQGTFDELMRSVNSQIETQYDSGRIQGADYAQAYVGMTQAALQVGSQFTLQAPLVTQQELLAQENIVNTKKQGLLLDEALVKAKVDSIIASMQLEVLTEQKAKIINETALVAQQTSLMGEQLAKVTEEIELVKAQVAHIGVQDSMLAQQEANALSENANIVANAGKIAAETTILIQKGFTEQAQRLDDVDGVTVAGIIGKQKVLYTNQANGFIRDSEQKAAKIHADFFTVIKSVTGINNDSIYGASGPQIKAVMDNMVTNIGVTPIPPAV